MELLGVDTGGTFTDFVLFKNGEISVHKVLSTPSAPANAILQGIKELKLDLNKLKVIHGSTVATNAVLEGKGVKTVYVTNEGLKDVLLIGRQARQSLYNLQPSPGNNPVRRDLCLDVKVRMSAEGKTIQPLSNQCLDQLVSEIEEKQPASIAINLLFSFLDPSAEEAIEKHLTSIFGDRFFITRSSSVLPEYKEYERGMTTWLNAYVGPLVQTYLQQLRDKISPAKLSIMMSAGGTASAEQAGKKAVHMLLSGPAGGLQAAKFVGDTLSCHQLLTFDMGGTSTDVALIDGEIKLSTEATIANLPVALPMVDMHTIGAGGGSIAFVDPGGMLQVGPESAGADPGPACYGKGGVRATVTDANVVLGRLPAKAELGGALSLDYQAAVDAVNVLATQLNCTLETAAEGIIEIANEHMVQALRMISVQKGTDPREFNLVSFGGAGGLHVCDIAEAMGVSKTIVPTNSGVFSAFGMLVSPVSRELSCSYMGILPEMEPEKIESEFDRLISDGMIEMRQEGVNETLVQATLSMDLCYKGQSFTLNVGWSGIQATLQAFHATHLTRYGHTLEEQVELINLRVSLKAQTGSLKLKQVVENNLNKAKNGLFVHTMGEVPGWERNSLVLGQKIHGPALIIENVATTLIKPGWCCAVVQDGHLQLEYKN